MDGILAYQRAYKMEKYNTDPIYRENKKISMNICSAIKYGGYKPTSTLVSIIGLEYNEYMRYIESTWTEGMSWDNYGKTKGCWNIDHIIPKSSATTYEELISRFFFKNSRAMWHSDNVRKGNRS